MEAIIKDNIQITTWNILNPKFENEKWYTTASLPYLHWESKPHPRKPKVLEYLKAVQSHIISIQETNSEIAMEMLFSLNKQNSKYDVIYHPRNNHDGCAIFYDKEKLELDKNNIKTFYYPKGQHLIQAGLFNLKSNPEKKFWIVNTHVKWATRDLDLLYLKSILDKIEGKIVLMGDFNATMNESWYSVFINSGLLNVFEVCQKNNNAVITLPKATFCGENKSKTIDYFFSRSINKEDHIKSFLGNDPQSPIKPDFIYEYLPNSELPSDHIPMSCIISL